MDEKTELAFLDYLKTYITPHKAQLMEEVLAKRTRYFTVVLEDIFKPHNASAVLRTADCFGIQDIHVIEKAKSYKINPYVTRGASQWVNLHKYENHDGKGITACFETLRSKGYKICATTPSKGSIGISELMPDQPLALVFGNEHEGVSQEVISQSDELIHIPMYGFTESFNISVSASIFLFDLLRKVNEDSIADFYISEEEKAELRSKWYRQLVNQSDIHEKEFLRKLALEGFS